MKRFLQILMFAAAVAVPWVTQAQQSLTVHDGTATNEYVPMYDYYADTRGCESQFIYPASDLASVPVGNVITQLEFYTQTVAGNTNATYVVKIGETSQSTYSSVTFISRDDLTTVYTGTMPSKASNSSIAIVLDNEYVYQGGNLVIDIFVETAGGYKHNFFYGEAASGSSLNRQSSTGTINQKDFLPKTTFTYAVPPSCPKPTGVAASNVSTTGATVGWTPAAASQNNFVVAYGTGADPDQMATVTATTNSAALTGLTANTTYNVYVKAVCSATDQSAWSGAGTFTTLCAPFAVPFSEDFEDAASGTTAALPDCWNRYNDATGSYNYYPYVYGTASYAHSGTKSIYFYASTSTSYAEHQMFILPAIDVATYPLSTLRLKFWAKRSSTTSSADAPMIVGVMSDPADLATFVAVDTVLVSNMDHQEFSVLLSQYAGSGAYIALRLDRQGSSCYCYVDDIVVDLIPTCIEVADVAVSDVTATGATISWTPAAASQNNFVVAYGTGTDPDQMATVTATTSSAALTGLTANTTYNAYVKAVCSATDQSAWSQMASFRTLVDCGAGYAYRAGVIGAGTSASSTYFTYASTTYANGQSGMIFSADELANYNLYSNNQLHGIKVHPSGSGSFGMKVFVGHTERNDFPTTTASDSLVTADMTQVFDGMVSFSANEWAPIMFDQPFAYNADSNLAIVVRRYTAPASSISFYYTSTSPDYVSYYGYKSSATAAMSRTRSYSRPDMGFVFCTQMPSCPSVSNVVASNITSASADIAWQLDDETQNNFVVAYGTGADPDQMATVSATTNSAVLAGLAANTTYNVYVKAVCGATDQSAWSSAGTFTTLCAPFAVPYTENFDSYAASTNPDCWTKIGPGTAVSAANTGTTYSHSGSMSLKFSEASAPNSNTIALPQFTAPTNTLELTLWTRPESFTSNNCGQFDVGYMTDPTDADSFVALATYNYDEFSDVEERIVNYSNAPANAAIALRHRANSNAYYWFVDDIDVHLIPSCPKPDIASASAIDAHSGLVQWTPAMPDQNNFVVAYGLGTDPSTMTTISATGTSAVISGLSALTKYNVFVKAVCGTGDESLWSTMASFSTPVDCGTGYELKDFTLGDGTSSSSSYAFYASTSYPFGYGAPIFTAEEVGANNLYENNTINAIRLHVGTTGGTINNAHIYMANVAIDNYTGASDTALFAGMTEVYSGTLDCPANQWITIPLTTPFAYDVNSNLMVRFVRSSTASAGVSFFYTSTSPNYYNIYGYRSSAGSTASATRTYSRPNVEFMICSEVPSCFPVQRVTASNVNTTNANISWTLNDTTQNSFTVAYGTTDDVATMVTTAASSTNAMLYGLTPNTTYYATVRANCGSEDVSSWCRTISFRTPCDIADSALFFENFDSYTDNAIPDCWEMGWWYQNPTSGVKVQPFITSTIQKFGGSGRSMSLQDQGDGTFSYLSTQCLPIDRAGKYTVSLQVYRSNFSTLKLNEGLKIWASPSANDTIGATLLGYIHRQYTLEPTVSAVGWYQYDFEIPQSGNQYILIEGVSEYGAATYFDNLEVKLTPCLKNIPYTNDFESAEVDMIPLCWDNSASTSSTLNSNPQYLWGVYNYNGNNMIRMCNYLVGPGNASINTNPFILPDTVCELKLDISNHANCPAAEILISNDGGNTFNMLDMVSATASSTSYSDPGTFVPKAYSLAGYAGDTVIFRFRTNANYGNGAIFIDNIQIRPVNSCIEPADVTAATVSTTSVAVSWTAGDATQNTFAVAYGTGNDPETMDTIIVSDTNTAVISGLTFEQNYNFYVKAICDETHSSYWSNSASAFLGYCSPAPTSVDNQGITNVSFGNGDETVNNSQRLTSDPFYGDFSSMIGGVTAADMANVDITYSTNYTYGTIIWVDWNNNLAFDGNEVVYAGEASAVAPTVLNASFFIPVTQDSGYYRMRIAGADSYYDNYTSSIEAAASANPCPTGSFTIVHDYTLHVLPAPSCLKPSNVVAANITDNSADIAWSSLDATQNNFVVAYGTGLNPNEMTTATATGNSMTFTGLTNATTYNVFVKAICSSDDESEWSNVCTFTTSTCSEESQCPVYISMGDAYGDGWNGGALYVVDADDNSLMATFALDDYDFGTDSVFICKGRSYNLVWSAGPYDEEVSFILTGATGDTIYEVEEPDPGFLTTFTGSCPITDSSVYVVFAVNDTTMGVTTPATGEYTYRIGDIVTATATANPGYEFINWNINVYGLGDTVIVGNPYTDTFPDLYAGMNVTITANFQVGTFDVTVLSNDNSLGVVAGSGSYSNGDTAILIATPAPNCHFVQWNDGDTNATRQVVVTADATYTATFALDQYALTVLANDTTMGTVTGAGSYNYGDTATLTAVANTGYRFVSWNDGDTNATRQVIVTADASYTATFAVNQYTLTVAANDTTMGTVTGSGIYNYGDTATLVATANPGYLFSSWNDGSTSATRTVIVTSDATYTAAFAADPCYNIALPFAEGFESDSPTLACWSSMGDNTWSVGMGDYSTGTGAHSGAMNAQIIHSDYDDQTKLITPVINVAGLNAVDLSFWYINRSWSGDIDYLTVYYRTDDSFGDWMQLGQQITDAAETWTNAEYTIPLNGASTIEVAFECYDNYGYGIGIDDVSIIATPSCVKPSGVVVSNVDAASAAISWTTIDTAQHNFVVAYGTGTNPDSMATATSATTSVNLAGLNSNTTYNVFVKAVCSATDQSAWSNMATFRTLVDCGDGYVYREGVIGDGASSNYNIFGYAYGTTSATYANGISGSIYTATDMATLNLYSNNLLQGIKVQSAGTGSMDMTIFVANTSKTSINSTTDTFTYADMTQVFNGTASFVAGEWTALMFDQPFAYDADSSLAVVIRRNAPVGTSIPIYYTSTSPDYYTYFDYKSASAANFGSATRSNLRPNMGFVFCTQMPACPSVNNVAASNITSTSADIAWQLDDTTQNDFVVAYGAGTDPDNMATVTATTASVALTGLTPAMTYNVFVKARCGATGQSNWSSMVTFSTPAIPATVPYFCGFEDATENNNWLTIAGAGVNHFVIGSDTNAVRSGANALYVADASGAYTYATGSATKTFAYRPVQMPAGTYIVNFDWSCTGGESTWDFGSVMIVPVEEPLVGGMGDSFSNIDWPNYIKRCEPDDKQFFNLTPGQNNYSGALTVTEAGTYNIVMMWSNDVSMGTANYPLSIDNFSIQNAYTLTVAANNDTMGTVTGSGVYAAGDTATMTATAGTGYRFVNWNDGDTHSVRTIVMNSDASYTAIFVGISQYAVTVMANDAAMGAVTGSGSYAAGDTVTLTAAANTGYHFVNWNDGDTNAIRQVIVTADVTYMANFTANQYTVTVTVNDTLMGTVAGAGTYAYGDTATLTATANTGYYFVSWNDGDTNATRQVVVSADTNYTATFAVNQYTLVVVANDNTMGTVTGSGIYNYNSTATLTATANTGYHFVGWNDSDTHATRQVVVTGDATYTATFAQDVVIPEDSLVVILAVNDSTMGTTNPAAGTYVFHVGDTAQAEAIPAAGFHFVNWSITVTGVGTPVTDNLIMMVVDSTMINQTVTVTANFAQDSVIPTTYTITLDVNDTTMGYVTGAGEYAEGAVAVIAAVAYDGFRFVNWSDGDINATRTISVGCDLSFTANFAADSTAMLVVVADETMGHVLINGEAVADNMFDGMLGDTVTIEAVANDGYHFVAWNDGDTNAVRIVVLDSAVVRLVAEFAQNVSIDDVETAEYTICTVSNRIVVRGAEQQPVYVFDVVGRLVAMTNAAAVEQSFTMSHTGIYLVKVANSAAKRVVIR